MYNMQNKQNLDIENLDKELFVAEYSFAQKQFHHDFLKNSLATNRDIIERLLKIEDEEERLKKLQSVTWIPFAIGTYEETSQEIDKLNEKYNFTLRV